MKQALRAVIVLGCLLALAAGSGASLYAQTLEVDVPAGLGPSIYNIWVVNPGGQADVLPGGVRFGCFVWLPL